ncbi:POX [Musa troglodytarum]|uniref:Autophagy-related protein 9 n=1 Tax=Musa troglodytarum TaxID=320322 RepID=A0A9E7I6C8_9LILI|nr:POX [Musa troglodytarum]
MNGLRQEAHVAQQSRRDKLRIPSDLLQQLRDACDPPMFSSSAAGAAPTDFAAGSQVPLIVPSSSAILGETAAALRRQPGCDWAAHPSLFPDNHSCHQQPKPGFVGYHDGSTDLHYVSLPLPLPSQGRDFVSAVAQQPCPWAIDSGGNELLPGYAADPANAMLMARQPPPQWSGDLMSAKYEDAAAVGGSDLRVARGLSLTLASSPVPELGAAQLEAGPSCPYPKFLISDRVYDSGGSLQDVVTSPGGAAARHPFTGYAAILKNSRFLRPAQQLLDEFCSAVAGSKLLKRCFAEETSRGASSSSKNAAVREKESSSRVGNSGALTSSGVPKVHRSEFQQKKAKLLHMQEEICRRYKQYHQQMQMVVSSFESVAGLNSAAPCTSLALNAISKHFRSLKNAISEQIQNISKVLGEELLSSPSFSRGEATTTPRSKYLDQSLQKQKAGESTLSFTGYNQPVWKPQRGLPERAVSVLRAWLFEHFLHPYPTDTDKHMLATQTGLSRNQVSNWFINARVRLWKPMIEEIHMLETKGTSGMDFTSANAKHTMPGADDGARPSMEPVFAADERSQEPWQGDKRSRVEESEMLMSFASYQHAMDVGAIDAVSLTLGLRHEGGQQNPHQMAVTAIDKTEATGKRSSRRKGNPPPPGPLDRSLPPRFFAAWSCLIHPVSRRTPRHVLSRFEWPWRSKSPLTTQLLDDRLTDVELSVYSKLPGPDPDSPSGLLNGEELNTEPIVDLDLFFGSLYNYYCEKGLRCITLKWIVEILSVIFVECFIWFFLLVVDWPALRNARCGMDALESGNKPCDLAKEAINKHPLRVDDIVRFVSDYTVYVDGVGHICSFSAFDFKSHGNGQYGSPHDAARERRSSQGKMEKSFFSFQCTYPTWEPSDDGRRFLSTLQNFKEKQIHQGRLQDNSHTWTWQAIRGLRVRHEIIHRFPSGNVFSGNGGFPRYDHHPGSVWLTNHEQRNHPYILDWYYTSKPLEDPANPQDSPSSEKEMAFESIQDFHATQSNLQTEVKSTDQSWDLPFSDRLQSHIEASTSGSLLKNSAPQDLDRHIMHHRWWDRTALTSSAAQASFLEPPSFGHHDYSHHSDDVHGGGSEYLGNLQRLSEGSDVGEADDDEVLDLPFVDSYDGSLKNLTVRIPRTSDDRIH